MGLLDSFKEWQSGRKERRIEKLTSKAADLNEDQHYDLLLLYKKGFIRVKGSGQSITKIYAEVENLIRKKLRVIVKPGTYFVSSGDHQNMATTTEYTFTLYPCSTEQLGINATCIDANRPIPGEEDQFYGVARVSDEVAKFLEASKNEDPMVIQAGVWTLTDNYSRSDVINHLVYKDDSGNTRHPVTHEHCDKAIEILEQLGISHNLWHSNIPYEKKTEYYEDGSKYVGEFRYGKPHGHGKYIMSEEVFYEGEFENGQIQGQGVHTYNDEGEKGKYIGEFKRGSRHGKGKFIWDDGSSYEGEYKAGDRHGHGKFIFSNNAFYEGEFENNKIHGKGKYTWPNGSSCDGDWKNGSLQLQGDPTGLFGDDDGPKKINRFEGTNQLNGWLHFKDGTKVWIFINSTGKWEIGEPPENSA
jgi:hypothetical protein